MPNLKKQFFFVHIPKTAGTTVALILARQFKWKKILSFYPPKSRKDFTPLSPDHINQFDLCFGHIPFPVDHKIERGIEYFTFLRKPRELILSGYRYVKGDNHGVKKVIGTNYSLKDFLKQGILKNFDNVMVRFLSGNIEKAYLEINEDDLKLAIKNFDTHFNIFGLTEYFDESLVMLAHHMNWAPLYYVRENRSAFKLDPKELDEENEKIIALCTKYDQILYDHAHKKFLKLLEEKRDVVATGLIELKNGNRKRKMILLLRNKASLLITEIRKKLS